MIMCMSVHKATDSVEKKNEQWSAYNLPTRRLDALLAIVIVILGEKGVGKLYTKL